MAHLKAHELPWLAEVGATTIVNVSGHSFDEYVQVIEALEEAPVDAYEVNISCPNVDAGGMTIGTHVESVERVVGDVPRTPRSARLSSSSRRTSPISPRLPRAAEAAGADAISLIEHAHGHGHRRRAPPHRHSAPALRLFRPRHQTRGATLRVAVP